MSDDRNYSHYDEAKLDREENQLSEAKLFARDVVIAGLLGLLMTVLIISLLVWRCR